MSVSFKVTFTKIRKHLETYKFKCSQAFLSLTKCWSVCEACRLGCRILIFKRRISYQCFLLFWQTFKKKNTAVSESGCCCEREWKGVAVRYLGNCAQKPVWETRCQWKLQRSTLLTSPFHDQYDNAVIKMIPQLFLRDTAGLHFHSFLVFFPNISTTIVEPVNRHHNNRVLSKRVAGPASTELHKFRVFGM